MIRLVQFGVIGEEMSDRLVFVKEDSSLMRSRVDWLILRIPCA